ncbi:MAG TPA: molybdopterin-dependent oxidoreductase [Isosphaeraceae bacterium]|jgi:DMSO/TMAO reductase YedYZ molybdopterin-dependent catalytic subunit/thiosulfate reductase cytochrome b subunit|nr:molybdopterin-dependent oxidoreductase [Isosphaeraceae bacterium]
MEEVRREEGDALQDRRLWLWLRPSALFWLAVIVVAPAAAAWAHYLIAGLPPIGGNLDPAAVAGPHGFPLWLRSAHYANLLLMVLLVRAGLSILMDHPRLYWNLHCTPGSEWIRMTPLEVPTDRVWTAKDDARYISPWLALPGGRHMVGLARHWHFAAAILWAVNGLVFAVLLFATGEWRRLVPTSWRIIPETWAVFVHYATFHMPPEPDGFYRYNSLQQLSYFGVVFMLAPLSILTGLAMSPAVDGRFPWYPRLFGNRQGARSIHFLLLLAYLGFVSVHVLMVVLTGLARNMDHIVMGTDETGISGLALGATGLVVIVLVCFAANWLCWRRPRTVQSVSRFVVESLMRLFLDPLTPRAQYPRSKISPHFWPNGKLPTCEEWLRLADAGFRDYRLRVSGMVENPVELSMEEIRALGKQEQTTLHHCIQGWSGIAEWGGLTLTKLAELVKPTPEARYVVFRSFGEGLLGGEYYDCHNIGDALHPQSLLAYEMNFDPLSHLHGAPLRLRVENQLGYKMVKWIKSIEFVADISTIGKGYGGKNEDDEYFDLVANI